MTGFFHPFPPKPKSSAWWLSVLIIGTLAGGLPATAQDSNVPSFVGQVQVEVVNVDVMVTDKDGNPVLGLGPDDFVITTAGEQREISNFYVLESGVTTSDSGPGRGSEDPLISARHPMRRRMVVLFDNNTLTGRDRAKAVEGIQQFIHEQFDGTYEWAVIAYGDQLHLLEPFTSNKDVVIAALHRVNKTPAQVKIDRAPQLQTEDSFFGSHVASRRQGRDVAGVRPISLDEAEVRSRVFENLRSLDETTKAAVQTMRAYSNLSGRKSLMLVTGMIKHLPTPANLTGQAFEGSGPAAGGRADPLLVSLQNDFNQRLAAMIRTANAAGFTVYPVTAAEDQLVDAPHLDAARSNSGALTTGPSFASIPGSIDPHTLPAMLAFGTGGVFYRTSKYHDAFFDADERTANAYVLGFRSDHEPDGKYHNIKVETKRPGLVVSHREGYLHITREEHLIDELSTPLTFPKDGGDFEVEVQVLTPERGKGKKVNLTVAGVVPLDVVTMIPSGDEAVGSVTLIVALYDSDGRLYKLFEDRQAVRLPVDDWAATERGAPARFALTLAGLKRGNYTVSFTLLDGVSKSHGTGIRPVEL